MSINDSMGKISYMWHLIVVFSGFILLLSNATWMLLKRTFTAIGWESYVMHWAFISMHNYCALSRLYAEKILRFGGARKLPLAGPGEPINWPVNS